MSNWLRNSGVCLAMAMLVACGDDPTPTMTVIGGSVRDEATEEPVRGAEVRVMSGAELQASALTDETGRFQLQFPANAGPGSQSLELSASLEGFRSASRPVVVNQGMPSELSYALSLIPEGVASCIQKSGPAVIVGHFRSAPGRPDPDLSARIADTFRYDLLTQIQKANFVATKQPGIFPCGTAKPMTPERYGRYARLLGADAYVGGFVTSPDPIKVKVQITVADGYGVMVAPLTATSSDVDLDDPTLARLAPEANAAVLTALAIGYKLSDKPQECVDLIAASERMLGSLPATLATLREECKAALPNRGLL
ncbi:carboxypeptidase regulatory-like domain-containing protein [Dokdonella sp.]|uniref:carboxypeptidase regulatory-like domain-containing protein n=1 Tax=Dokdonella sp. TaxID=2291710 RepID=UPI003C50E579